MRSEVLLVDERFGKEYAGRYVFCEISWAKRNRIIQKYTRYSQVSGQVLASDYVAVQAETIWASLKEQPKNKPVSLEKLLGEEDGVPVGLGELFSEIANRLNGLGVDEARFLSEPFAEESLTERSLSSDCARNSDGRRSSLQGNQQKPSSNSSSS